MNADPAQLPSTYYDFGSYVDRARWLTYYEQIRLMLKSNPSRVLEVGVGPGVVKAVLASHGCTVVTVDFNEALKPDVVADLRALPSNVTSEAWDWVLVSRVLHHIPSDRVADTLARVALLDYKHALVSVPREDLSLQVSLRRTAGASRQFRVSGGSRLKRMLRRRVIKSKPSGLWMLDGQGGPSRSSFRGVLEQHFKVNDEFILDDDPAHVFYVLQPRG